MHERFVVRVSLIAIGTLEVKLADLLQDVSESLVGLVVVRATIGARLFLFDPRLNTS